MAGTGKGGRKWRERGRAGKNDGNEEGRENKAGRIGGGEYTAIRHIFERDAEGGKMHAAVGVRVAERT